MDKNKIHIYAALKKFISNLKTHTDWKWGDEKQSHTKRNRMTTGVATLTSDKTDFKTKTVTRVKEGHHKMIKGPIQE